MAEQKMYKLLLINPKEQKSGLGSYKGTSVPPIGLGYIAALTPTERYEIAIIDENIISQDMDQKRSDP